MARTRVRRNLATPLNKYCYCSQALPFIYLSFNNFTGKAKTENPSAWEKSILSRSKSSIIYSNWCGESFDGIRLKGLKRCGKKTTFKSQKKGRKAEKSLKMRCGIKRILDLFTFLLSRLSTDEIKSCKINKMFLNGAGKSFIEKPHPFEGMLGDSIG